jgi:hypothetical protein
MAMPSSVCDRLGVDGCEATRAGYGELRRLRRVVRSAPGVPGVPPGLSSGISMAAGLDAGLETGDTDIECWLADSLQPVPSSGERAAPQPFISSDPFRPTQRSGGRQFARDWDPQSGRAVLL